MPCSWISICSCTLLFTENCGQNQETNHIKTSPLDLFVTQPLSFLPFSPLKHNLYISIHLLFPPAVEGVVLSAEL